ncbi:MAG: 50S ribosomal protein L23 [Nitrososphaerota archaeon]|nr:50S ribosomal protein L23 [Nitrososphaerales archaeon]MDW8044301.1 50S ribosomal protein L23 [Nitrososphaerota archaeon]
MQPDEALRIIKRPYITEKTFEMIEKENKLVFIVDDDADKRKIKSAIETLYNVKVQSVNTARTIYGKKAYVRLSKESSAIDLASKLGVV